jgi:WhiB family transcriptional regulator, redox-sensing transcriptional regulator
MRVYRSVTVGVPLSPAEELPVSSFSTPHLNLINGYADRPEAIAPTSWPALAPGDESWRLDALCAETDPEAFFPEKGGSTREAKRVCVGCDVRAECLEYALANDERFGIWGGLSERERRRLRLARRAPLSA